MHAVVVGALDFDCVGKVDRGRIDANIDGLDRGSAGDAEHGYTCDGCERSGGAKK